MTSIATRFNKSAKTTKNTKPAHGRRFSAVLEALEPRKMLSGAPVGGSIIFVDHDVIDAQAALRALPGAEVVFLRHDRSGFDQVSEVLAQRRGLESIQFVSHGSSGQVGLGGSKLDALTLHDLAGTISGWGDALSETGDIALWGCDVASDAAGRAFVRDLASVTSADVAASMNRTGSTSLGADWVLEYRAGAIETKLTSPFMPHYQYVLGGNNAPTIGGTTGFQGVTDVTTINPFTGVTIGDVDNDMLAISVTLDSAAKGVFTPASLTASGFVDAGGGAYTFSGSPTAASAAIALLVFDPTDNRVTPNSTETTTFTISASDGIAAPVTDNTTSVFAVSINDAPTITGVSTFVAVADSSTVRPFPNVVLGDVDNPAQTQTISVTLDSAAKGVFTPGSLTASGFVDAGGGVYTFSGTAAQATAAINLLFYNPTDNRVAPGTTEVTAFTISVNDGIASPVTNSASNVYSVSVNDAPTIGGTSAGQAVNDNATVTLFSAVTLADVDSPAQTQSVTVTLDAAAKGVFTAGSLAASGFVDAGSGIYTFSGTAAASQAAIRQLVFDPTNNRVSVGSTETTTFTISVFDGLATPSTNNSTTVVSTSVNDAPTIGGASAGQAVNETSTVTPFSSVTVADVDSPAQTMTVSVTLDTAAKGVFTPGSLTASGFVSAGGGVYTFSGTAAATQTAIRLLAFDPTDNRVNTGSTETTTFTISVDDGIAAAATNSTTTVVSTAINEAPTIGGVASGQAVNDTSTVTPFSAVTIADPDTAAQTQTVSVTLDTAAKGVFTAGSLAASGFVDAGGGVYTFSGTAAATQTAIRQLVFNPTDNRVAPASTETTTFTISVDDGVASPSTNSATTVVSTSVNDAPTIGGAVALQAVNDNATLLPLSALTIADVDPNQTQTVTVTLDNGAKGVFTPGSLASSGFVDSGGGAYTFSGTAAASQTAIRTLVYDPTNDRVAPGMTETTTFIITVNDGIAAPATDSTTTVISTSINDAPIIGGVSAGQTVNDNSTVLPFSATTIADPDNPAQTMTVSVTLDTAAKGVFTPASLTASGFVDAGGGVYTFSGTAAATQTAIRLLSYDPTNNRVAPASTETTTFTISVNDGIAAATTDSTTTVVSTSVNDAPTIGGVSAGQAVNDNATVTLFSAVTIADVDSPAQTMTVSVTLDTAAKGVFTSGSLIASGFVDAGGGVYTFSGTAAATQTAIRQLVFDPTDNRVTPTFTETTTFTISVNDGVASPVTDNTTTVVSTSVNDAPTIGGAVAGQAVNDTATVIPFSALTIADVDPGQTQTVSVTLDTAAKGVFTPGSLVASGFTDAGGGVYTFSGSASAAQTAIRQLVYNPTDNRVTPASTETTTFTVSVNDGVAAATTNSTTMVVSTSVNDAPTIGGTVSGQAASDVTNVQPFTTVTFADVDSPAQTQTISVTLDTAAKGVFTPGSLAASGFADAGGGVYTFSGTAAASQTAIRQLVYNPTDNRVTPGSTETTTFTISESDGVASPVTDSATTVVSASVNDAPTIGGTVAGQGVNDNSTVTLFSAVTMADPDSPAQTQTITVVLDNAAKGVFTPGSLAASGFSDVGGGIYTFSGNAAAAQTAIRQLVFNPTNDRVTPGSTETTTFTISMNDGIAPSATNNLTTVVSVSINDAPTIGGTVAAQPVNDNATLTPFATITVTDPDFPAQTQTVSITLDTAAKGVFTVGSLIAAGFSDAGSGVYTFSGSAANAQSGMRQLVFNPTDNRVAVGATETTTFTISVNDGIAAPATNSATTVVSTSANDAPTIGGVIAGQAVNDTATVAPFSAVTVVDVDVPAQTIAVTVLADSAKGVFTVGSLAASGFVDQGGGVYSFGGTAANVQTAIRQLVFDPTDNRVAPLSTETTTFTIELYDGFNSAMDTTTTVVSTSVNDAPTLGGASAGQTTNDNVNHLPFTAVTIADVDPAQNMMVSVTLDTAAKGVFTPASLTASGFVDAGSGVYTFTGLPAAAQTGIRLLDFNPTNDRVNIGLTETTTFTISVSDGIATPATDSTTTVVSTSVNDGPAIGGVSAGQAVNDNATVSVFSTVTISDTDTPTQTLVIIVTIDTAAKGVFTAGSVTASGFADLGSGQYAFVGSAAASQVAIRQLVFNPTDNRVAVGMTETTTFQIDADDGIAAPSTNSTTTVVSTSVNDAPTIGGTVASQAVNDNDTVSPFSGVTIADVDSPAQTMSVTVTIDDTAKGVFTAGSLMASGFVDAGSGVYTFSGTAAASQTAIRQLVFNPTNDRAAVGTTETSTFTIDVSDGITSSNNTSTTVVSTSTNDAPTIGGASAGQAVNDNTTVMPFSMMTIADVDPGQSQAIIVTLDDAAKGVFTPASLTASGFADAGSGIYTFTGTATASQAAIRQLVFNPTDNAVGVGMTQTTTFTVNVNDGIATPVSNSATTVISTSVNETPTILGTVSSQAVNDTGTISPFSGVTILDGDSPAETLSVSVTIDTAAKGTFTVGSLMSSGFVDAGGGVYTFSGTAAQATAAIQQLVFDPTENRVAPTSTETSTFTISVNDGVASPVTDNTTTVVSTSVNDVPVIGGATSGQTVNDNATLLPFSTVTFADVDSPAQMQSITITLNNGANGVFTGGSLSASGFVDAGGGVYTFSGTAADSQTAIRQLVFNPADNRVAVGSTETTTFTISMNDGLATPVTDATTTVVSTSVNDAPTIGATAAGQTVNDTATLLPFSVVTISDVDPSQTQNVIVSLDSLLKGVFTPGSLTASGFVDAGSGVYTFSGTAAAAQTAIRQLVFNPADNRVAVGSTETTTFTITVVDGVADPATDSTTTVVSTSINDAPTLGGIAAGQPVNDTATVMPFSVVTFADVDSPAQTQLVTIALDNSAKGAFTSGSLIASGFADAGGGTYTFSGTASAAQTAIRQLVFQPTPNRVAVGSTETTTFALTINDTIAFAASSGTTVVSTSINNAPTVGGAVAGQAVTDVTTVLPFTTFTIGDVDPSQTMSVSVTLDTAAKGVFTPASLTASGFISAGGGAYTFTGTAAAAQTGIRLLAFDPTNYRVAPASTETTTFTISVNDGVASPVTNTTTTVVSTGTNATPTLTTIGTLAGATARLTYTISYTSLLTASNAADANTGDTIRFRVESILNGTVTKNGVPVTTGVTTLAAGENLVWTSGPGASGTTGAFTVRAFDGTVASASAITVNVAVTAIAPATAAVNTGASASSNSTGLVTVVTRNDAGQTILLQQTSPTGSWVRVNLTAVGVPTVTGGTVTFVDPATGMTHAAVVTASGLYLLSDTGTGFWISRNLTTEISGSPAIVGDLVHFTTTDGLNVITGRTAGGDVVIYNQTGALNGQGRSIWAASNVYSLLRTQGEPTPAFTTPLTSYVTSWNGLNIAGLDSSGNIWTVWTGGGFSAWHSTNLSAITGSPSLNGGVTAFTTSWGGINLAGIDVNGDLSVTWWVPSFAGNWNNVNFTTAFGGPDLQAGSLTSYVTSWNAMNIAGLDNDGNVVQYWWVPPSSPSEDFWRVSPLTSALSPNFRRPNEGKLSGMATADSRLNLIGSNDDGHIVRLWWSPTHDWSLEDLTVLAS